MTTAAIVAGCVLAIFVLAVALMWAERRRGRREAEAEAARAALERRRIRDANDDEIAELDPDRLRERAAPWLSDRE